MQSSEVVKLSPEHRAILTKAALAGKTVQVERSGTASVQRAN
ncbi:hypothetical protein [Consotaella aegiceratis]